MFVAVEPGLMFRFLKRHQETETLRGSHPATALGDHPWQPKENSPAVGQRPDAAIY